VSGEISTIVTTLRDVKERITAEVDQSTDTGGDVYRELVNAERTIGRLLRSLERVERQSGGHR
jgi:hypothetical protein